MCYAAVPGTTTSVNEMEIHGGTHNKWNLLRKGNCAATGLIHIQFAKSDISFLVLLASFEQVRGIC